MIASSLPYRLHIQPIMAAEIFVAETTTRLSAIENAIANYMMPDDGRTDRQIVSAIINMERDIANRLNDSVLNALIDAKIISSANIIQAINDTAQANRQQQSTSNSDVNSGGTNRLHKIPILESKSMIDIGKLEDGKTYRSFNRKMKNALDQVRPSARAAIEYLEAVTEAAVNEQAVLNPRTELQK